MSLPQLSGHRTGLCWADTLRPRAHRDVAEDAHESLHGWSWCQRRECEEEAPCPHQLEALAVLPISCMSLPQLSDHRTGLVLVCTTGFVCLQDNIYHTRWTPVAQNLGTVRSLLCAPASADWRNLPFQKPLASSRLLFCGKCVLDLGVNGIVPDAAAGSSTGLNETAQLN